jgi:ribosomal protein L3 glutamine methyltransferase
VRRERLRDGAVSERDALSQGAQAAVKELRTAADMVRWCASRFNENGLHFGHGTRDAVEEGVALVLHTLNLAAPLAPEMFAARLTRSEREQVTALALERIRSRKPLPYLTGEAWFAGLAFQVDERVLIPRSPLAEWIERGFEPFVDAATVRQVVDVGTGSGCIAVACAMAFPAAAVDAVDCSGEALQVAAQNLARHGLEARVRLLHGDLLEPCPGPYDIIVSNPPYVGTTEFTGLPAEYGHEPAGALRSGPDGMDAVRVLLRQSAGYLTENGVLVVEVGNTEARVRRAFPRLPCVWLSFARGGGGVFLLTAAQLRAADLG